MTSQPVLIFAEHQTQILALHLLGVAIGLGGATIADSLFFRFLRDLRISLREAEVLQWIARMVTAALLVIFLTGAGLYLGDPLRFQESPAFVFKMLVVVVLTVNGLLLHAFVSPKLVKITFLPSLHAAREGMLRIRRVAFAMGAVSVVSWYTVFFVSMLKTLLPESVTLPMLLGGYVAMIAIAVFCSRMVESALHKRGTAA